MAFTAEEQQRALDWLGREQPLGDERLSVASGGGLGGARAAAPLTPQRAGVGAGRAAPGPSRRKRHDSVGGAALAAEIVQKLLQLLGEPPGEQRTTKPPAGPAGGKPEPITAKEEEPTPFPGESLGEPSARTAPSAPAPVPPKEEQPTPFPGEILGERAAPPAAPAAAPLEAAEGGSFAPTAPPSAARPITPTTEGPPPTPTVPFPGKIESAGPPPSVAAPTTGLEAVEGGSFAPIDLETPTPSPGELPGGIPPSGAPTAPILEGPTPTPGEFPGGFELGSSSSFADNLGGALPIAGDLAGFAQAILGNQPDAQKAFTAALAAAKLVGELTGSQALTGFSLGPAAPFFAKGFSHLLNDWFGGHQGPTQKQLRQMNESDAQQGLQADLSFVSSPQELDDLIQRWQSGVWGVPLAVPEESVRGLRNLFAAAESGDPRAQGRVADRAARRKAAAQVGGLFNQFDPEIAGPIDPLTGQAFTTFLMLGGPQGLEARLNQPGGMPTASGGNLPSVFAGLIPLMMQNPELLAGWTPSEILHAVEGLGIDDTGQPRGGEAVTAESLRLALQQWRDAAARQLANAGLESGDGGDGGE